MKPNDRWTEGTRRRRARKLRAWLLTAGVALCGLIAAVGTALAFGLAATDLDAPDLTLSAALRQATDYGPGFASAALQAELGMLADEAEAARRRPAVTLSSRTELHPALQQVLSGTLAWELSDELSVDLAVSAASGTGVSARAADRLSVRFHRSLWPPQLTDAAADGRALDQHVARLRAERASFDAMREVISAFYSLRDARFGVAVAEQALSVAEQRARMAADRFSAGQLGLSEWQAAQRAERQAQIEARAARTAHDRAAERLARLLFAVGHTKPDGADPFGALVDDLPWAMLVQVVESILAIDDAVSERILSNDTAYLEAVRAEMRQSEFVSDAERATKVNWHATVEYTHPLGSPVGASGTATGVSDGTSRGEGELLAYIGATLNLGSTGRIRHEEALVSLELARLRTEQARHAALDSAEAAMRKVEDAVFVQELAVEGFAQAEVTLGLVERRIELGFAAPLELDEARLELLRAERELARSEAELRLAWLDVAYRLGATAEFILRLH